MKKTYLKCWGMECLYMLLNILIACISATLQRLERNYLGDFSSVLFSGSYYSYNIFFYLLGLCAYVLYIIFSYRNFFSGRVAILRDSNWKWKALYIITALLFSFLMLVALVFMDFYNMGMATTANMQPEILFYFAMFGFPIGTAVYMILIVAIHPKQE